MWWIIDIIVIVFILLCVFYGYKKGLVKVGLKLLNLIIAILITFILYRPIGDLIINNTQIDENIENTILSKLEKNDKKEDKELTEYALDNAKKVIMPEMTKNLTINIIYICTTITLFLLSRLILFIISSCTSVITNLPIIQQCNKVGGIVYGMIIGIIIVYTILLIIKMYCQVNPENEANKIIKETLITNTMYSTNIFELFLNN